MSKNENKEEYCGECPLFMYEDINGLGFCAAQKGWMHCADVCAFWTAPMDNDEVLRILHYARKWRRGANTKILSPVLLGLAIDNAMRIIRNLKKNNQ